MAHLFTKTPMQDFTKLLDSNITIVSQMTLKPRTLCIVISNTEMLNISNKDILCNNVSNLGRHCVPTCR